MMVCAALQVLLAACSENGVRREMKHFIQSEITFPETMERVNNGSFGVDTLQIDRPVLIIYYDSTECSSCKITHLTDLEPVYELYDSLGTFDVITIFSPPDEEQINVLEKLMMLEYPHTVYIDFAGAFRDANDCIPADKRFHSFLLDSGRKPFYVGNPTGSEQLWNLFTQAVSILDMKENRQQ